VQVENCEKPENSNKTFHAILHKTNLLKKVLKYQLYMHITGPLPTRQLPMDKINYTCRLLDLCPLANCPWIQCTMKFSHLSSNDISSMALFSYYDCKILQDCADCQTRNQVHLYTSEGTLEEVLYMDSMYNEIQPCIIKRYQQYGIV